MPSTNQSEFPDYYKLLIIPKTASQDEIRQAYKRESLKSFKFLLCCAAADCAIRTEHTLIGWPKCQERKRGWRLRSFRYECTSFATFNFLKKAARQAIADAYYVLSDPKRRIEYDKLYNARSDRTDAPGSSHNFFTQFSSMFGTSSNTSGAQSENAQPDPNGMFADVFEEVCFIAFNTWQSHSSLR